MRFEGEFRVPGAPQQVIEAFADVERMVKCMPGAGIEGRDSEGNYLGTMWVAFGPKKIKFKGKVTASVDVALAQGSLRVRGAADMRAAARVEVQVRYSVRADSTSAMPLSIVSLTSDAELGGVLADFGRTGGIAVTQALMETFAVHVAKEFSGEQAANPPAAPSSVVSPTTDRAVEPASLSVIGLLWLMLKARFAAVTQWVNRNRPSGN